MKKIILLSLVIFLFCLKLASAKDSFGFSNSFSNNFFNIKTNEFSIPKCSVNKDYPGSPKVGTANPAAIYCQDLGYDYKIINTANGQDGVCIFPDKSQCEEWQFLDGECGQNYSYCALNGYDIITKDDGNNSISPIYSVCVNKTTSEKIGSVSILSKLSEKATKSGENVTVENPNASAEGVSAQSVISLPSYFDWRDATYNGINGNWATNVEDQGICGACWAFSTVESVETAYKFYKSDTNVNLNLSEEYLVSDCFSGENCCGGWPSDAGIFIRDRGIPDYGCMPYVDTGCSCSSTCIACLHRPSTEAGACSNAQCSDRCSDWNSRLKKTDTTGNLGYLLSDGTSAVAPSMKTIKEYIIEFGSLPTVMGILGDVGGHFDNGIYRCDNDNYLNHAVALVGWNDTGEYWIVQNSWGSGWLHGTPWYDHGYFKVGYGECFIDKYLSYSSGFDRLTTWSGWQLRSDSYYDGPNSIVETFQSPTCPAGTNAVSCSSESATTEREDWFGEDDLLNIMLGNNACNVTARDALVGTGEHKRDVGVVCLQSSQQPQILWGGWQLRNGSSGYHDGADSTVETFQSPTCPAGTYAVSCLTQSANAESEGLYGEDYILGIGPYWLSNGTSGCNVTAFDYIVPDGEHKRMNGVVCMPTKPILSWGVINDNRDGSRYDGDNADVETFYGGYCPVGTYAVSCLTQSANAESEPNYGEDAVQNIKVSGGRCMITTDDVHGDYEQKRSVATVCMPTPPAITILSPVSSPSYHKLNVLLNFTISSNSTRVSWIGYSLDGKPNITIPGPVNLSNQTGPYLLSDGSHTITVYANDTFGNMGSSSANFYYCSGDVNNDKKIDGKDIALISLIFGSAPGYPKWDASLDINNDNKIDGKDVTLTAMRFGKGCP